MNTELVDRLIGRIVQETRLARAARHPRARIAHHMLADAYRAMISRITMGESEDEHGNRPARATQSTTNSGVTATGFFADVSA